jgi:hypothetical protein
MLSTTTAQPLTVIKIEDSPEPEAPPTLMPPPTSSTNTNPAVQPIDPKDPEGFLRRCAGYNKKKGVRCSAAIGRNSQYTKNLHPTFLATCHAHKDQQSYAGWCQFMSERGGERCGRLFRWTPPYLELCSEHQGHPDTPCYFLKLPLELRLEVFRYLLPCRPIGSSTALVHAKVDVEGPGFHGLYALANNARRRSVTSPHRQTTTTSIFKMPLLSLLLINRQICEEVKDLLYSTVPFTIDVRKDGTFMCGRRLLEPKRADGSSHSQTESAEWLKAKFLNTFNWSAVKNYNVDILVENWKEENMVSHGSSWDEEVEIYDIRDYIGVVVSGILGKSRNLCKLNVRLGISKFVWNDTDLLANVKTLVGPFERLRNVRQPRFVGVYEGAPMTNYMIYLPMPAELGCLSSTQQRLPTPICSVPALPTDSLLRASYDLSFNEYRSNWQRWISSPASSSLVHKPPICAMFTEFKDFYTRLSTVLPVVMSRNGKHAFLHRARVAREQEDVEAFRLLRNELIECWYVYLEQEEKKKDEMNMRLSRLLDTDVYPSSYDEDYGPSKSSKGKSAVAGSSAQAPLVVDVDTMEQEVNNQRVMVHIHHSTMRLQKARIAQMQQMALQYSLGAHSGLQFVHHSPATEAPLQQSAPTLVVVPSKDKPTPVTPTYSSLFNNTKMTTNDSCSSSSSSSSSSSGSANISSTTSQTSTLSSPPSTQREKPDNLDNRPPASPPINDSHYHPTDTTTTSGESSKSSVPQATFTHPQPLFSSPSPTHHATNSPSTPEPLAIFDDYVDVFKEWADQQPTYTGKGKGKAAVESGSTSVDVQTFGQWVQQQQERQQELEGECMSKGNRMMEMEDGEVMWLCNG